MLEWKCEITRGENGYIMSWEEEMESTIEGIPTYVQKSKVFEEEFYPEETDYIETELVRVDDEKVAFTKLVHALAEHFGIHYNKYETNNLKVTWDKEGHKC